mmetsp:Transcript_34911/g.81684  ORF Transcript_34911/g.81684 Transcript_34911/m.81684 type:complete len:434 (+) Transcript_34911:131-1432(+)
MSTSTTVQPQTKHWKNGVGYCARNGSGTAIVMLALGEVDLRTQLLELTMLLEWLSSQQAEMGCRAVCFEVRSVQTEIPPSGDITDMLCVIDGLSLLMKSMPQVLVAVADGVVPNMGTLLYGLCDFVLATPDAAFALTDVHMQIPLYFLRQMGPLLSEYILSTGLCMGVEDAKAHGFVTASMPRSALQELQAGSLTHLMAVLATCGGIKPRTRGSPLRRTGTASTGLSAVKPPIAGEKFPNHAAKAQEQMVRVNDSEDCSTTDDSESEGTLRKGPNPLNVPVAFCVPPVGAALGKPLCSDVAGGELCTLETQQEITSVMIRNIPCRVTAEELGQAVDESGFRGLYDFLYMPKGNRRSKARDSNLGYGFVNFPDPRNAQRFMQEFTGYRFPGTKSVKEVEVRPSYLQGAKSMRSIHPDWAEASPVNPTVMPMLVV